jgi:hypothetical protein
VFGIVSLNGRDQLADERLINYTLHHSVDIFMLFSDAPLVCPVAVKIGMAQTRDLDAH